MILNEENNIWYYQFPNLMDFPELKHGIFTRNNGYSLSPFQSLNTSMSVGDEFKSVQKNRSAILSCMGEGEPVFLNQVHGKKVIILSKYNPPGSNTPTDTPPRGDALVSNLKNKWLIIQVADCQAVLIYDPRQRVMANIHSGWRGSIENIIDRSIREMKTRFSSNPGDLVAGIGPSLGPCCAEFVNYQKEIPEQFWIYKEHENHFNFWAMSRDQLTRAGLLTKNIYGSKICTKCHIDHFFSYRGEGKTGRFAAVMGLR